MAEFLYHLWPAASPSIWQLSQDEVHVWCARLESPAARLGDFERMLVDVERQRAGRFHFDADRQRYIVQHGLLRWLIGRYLGPDGAPARLVINPYGKPSLPGSLLRFNQSASGDVGLFAFAWGREVGVDVERVRLDFEHEQIAQSFFSPAEQVVWQSLPTEERPRAFFHCWTRKEAYLKAYGQGLSLPLGQFDVAFAPGESAGLLAARHAPAEVGRWKFLHLEPVQGYVGALVVEGDGWQAVCRHLELSL